MPYTFDSSVSFGSFFCKDDTFTPDAVKNEPMFFNCDSMYAYGHGGPITRAFIAAFWNANPDIRNSDLVF